MSETWLERFAQELHATWREPGSKFWHELSEIERENWLRLADCVDSAINKGGWC